MAYKNIDSYGLIGDLHTAALVSTDGSIDWCCLPRFDSPSVFGAMLDDRQGGYFRVWATSEGRYKQMYLPDTNVLMTRFLSPDGIGEVLDFMPWVEKGTRRGGLVRIARCVRGCVSFRMECVPAFDYARQKHEVQIIDRTVRFGSPALSLTLESECKLEPFGNGGVSAEFTLAENQKRSFILEMDDANREERPDLDAYTRDQLFRTIGKWRGW
ncbi:MAG: glycoside hydrolase family 15 protein, partial [Acidobacteriaceae bacterium]|nr:glycoside hydrolase family 15 protein [Acidobacteriaceae bacterium]